MTDFVNGEEFEEPKPVVFVLSDARGKTAGGVVESAADQFAEDAIIVKQLGNVNNVEMVCDYLDKNREADTPTAVFHTIADKNLRRDWDPVYGDRMQKIVFIGQNLDKAAIKEIMDSCLAE